jgi:hypothetical protein
MAVARGIAANALRAKTIALAWRHRGEPPGRPVSARRRNHLGIRPGHDRQPDLLSQPRAILKTGPARGNGLLASQYWLVQAVRHRCKGLLPRTDDATHGYEIDGRLLRTGAANFSASGLQRQDNDLIVIGSAAAAFKRTFDARFAGGEQWRTGPRDFRVSDESHRRLAHQPKHRHFCLGARTHHRAKRQ